MTTTDLVAEARAIRDLYSGEAAIGGDTTRFADRLKDLVQSRLVESNPEANIERTSYFNHSAIPDFLVTWGKSQYPRGVYLRGSYAAIIAASDIQASRRDDPIFMSLDESQDFELGGQGYSRTQIQSVVAETRATLVTDLGAFAAATAPPAMTTDGPLQSLVRSNFVRGGRGLFDTEQVQQFVDDLAAGHRGSVLDEVGEYFTETAQGEFQRAGALIDLTRSGGSLEALDVAHLLRGKLTYDEVRSLLPWILDNSAAPVGAPLWRLLGSMLSLELLEHESSALRGIDLSRLVESNLDVFAATRAYAGLNVQDETDRESVGAGARWAMMGTTLTRLEGPDAVRFAQLGTRLKSTGTFTVPRWSAVRPRLANRTLAGVTLSGIDEVIRVDSRRGRSIYEYLDQVIPPESADNYFVDEVTVRLEGEDREVKVDFTSRLILPSVETTLSSMLELAGLLEALNPELRADAGDALDTMDDADD